MPTAWLYSALIVLVFTSVTQAQTAGDAAARAEGLSDGTLPSSENRPESRPASPDPLMLLADAKVSDAGPADRRRGDAAARNLTDGQEKGTSSAAARRSAIENLPLQNLSAERRARVDEILESTSFFRRLPTLVFAVDPEVYTFFVSYPDVAVSVWRAMKISKLEMWQTGRDEYEGDAGDGTVGTIEVLYRGPDKHLILCDGLFKSPIIKNPIKARSLVMLQTSFFQEADGNVYVTHRADMFVSFPSQTVEAVAKLLSPLAIGMTDRTFSEISMFLKLMSVAMSRRPDWVEQIVNQMDGVPDLRRQQMLKLTAHVFTESIRKEEAAIAARKANSAAVPRVADREGPAPSRELGSERVPAPTAPATPIIVAPMAIQSPMSATATNNSGTIRK